MRNAVDNAVKLGVVEFNIMDTAEVTFKGEFKTTPTQNEPTYTLTPNKPGYNFDHVEGDATDGQSSITIVVNEPNEADFDVFKRDDLEE